MKIIDYRVAGSAGVCKHLTYRFRLGKSYHRSFRELGKWLSVKLP